MKNLYSIKKRYNPIIIDYFKDRYNITINPNETLYAEINNFDLFKEASKYHEIYRMFNFYDKNKKYIGCATILCDHTYFSLINRDELLKLARNLEIGIENLYINDGNDGLHFIAILKDVYARLIELENNK